MGYVVSYVYKMRRIVKDRGKDRINEQSLWNDTAIEETIKRMDPDQLYRYQKMAQTLYEKANDPNPHTVNMEVAAQVRLMLRDGLHPDMLEENERQIYIDVYGLKSLEEYTKDDDDRSDDQCPDSDKGQDQGVPSDSKWTTKAGKRIGKRDPKLPQRTKRAGHSRRRHHVHHTGEPREEDQPQQEGPPAEST
jgi:hypothetical protein